jgi:hypothetical protein
VRKRAIPPTTTEARTAAPARKRVARYALFAALLLVAAVAAVTIAVILGARSGTVAATTTQTTVTPVGPTVLSATGLKARVAALDEPVYWIGPVAGTRYELTRTTDGNAYVRYLPPGTRAGAAPGEYVVVGTYPYRGAFAAVRAAAHGKVLTVSGGKGGIAEVERGRPTNVHVGFPHLDYQVEVYAPRPKAARTLATGGSLTPVP